MKTIKKINGSAILSLVLLLVLSYAAEGQKKNTADAWLKKSLKEIPDRSSGVQSYLMTTDYVNYDLNGNFLNKLRISGTYSCGLENGNARWNNCSIAQSNSENGIFPVGEKLSYMEEFTYLPGANMVSADAFPNFPPDGIYAKNLVWDMLGFDAFGLAFLDSLRLNKAFSTKSLEGAVPLAGEGSFVNKNTMARWNGVSEMNGRLCAVIEFRQLNGSVEMKNPGMEMKGRSHYWGNIWISLSGRNIEYADLYESVLMKMKFAGQEKEQWFDIYRILTLKKTEKST